MIGLVERALLLGFVACVAGLFTGYWQGDDFAYWSVVAILCGAGYALVPLVLEFWQALTKAEER